VVTIDAMGTQTDIMKKIVQKEADYCLVVKQNQKTLNQTSVQNLNNLSKLALAMLKEMDFGKK